MVKGGRGKKRRSKSRSVFRMNARKKKEKLAREKAKRASKKKQHEQVRYSNWLLLVHDYIFDMFAFFLKHIVFKLHTGFSM